MVPNVITFYAMAWSCSDFRYDFRNEGTKHRTGDILTVDLYFWNCVAEQFISANRVTSFLLSIISNIFIFAMFCLKFIHGNHFRSLCIILAASFYCINTFPLKHFFPYTQPSFLCSSYQVHIGASDSVCLPCPQILENKNNH